MHKRMWAAAVLALALLAAGCGQSASGGNSVASADGSKADQTAGEQDKDKQKDAQQAGLDFARCMREHGVDMPDPQADGGFLRIGPGPGEGGPSQAGELTPPEGFEEADKVCRHHLEGLIQDGGGPIDPAEQDRALKFAQCMRDHGVEMPDPDFSKGGVRIQIGGEGFDPNSQVFKDAQKACGGLFGPARAAGTRS
jgi:hypothetical protein